MLHNAAKFTNEGFITVDAHIREGKAVILVSDTGIGIEEGQQQSIFEPYEQGGSGNADNASGLGLGLSICKQLVELHQGTLAVSSIPNSGSVFTFTLPISDSAVQPNNTPAYHPPEQIVLREAAAAYSELPAATSAEPGADRPRILAVDDDPINLSVLESVLSSESYEIITAAGGKEALALLTTREWDLVITDVMMPNMSGYQLSQAVRERFAMAELPILLLTARSRPEDIEIGFQAGANDYLMKPVDALELKSRVRALTDNKKSFRERLRVEAAWLQAQIQPHFLFNTLNSIGALSEIDINRMRALLDVFGDYLRASFDSRNLERFVPLEHELELVRSYLYIEKERFEDRVRVFWEVDDNIELELPPLTIQPLVENAIKHGILKRAKGGNIHIRISGHQHYAEIVIEDDGVGIEADRLEKLLITQTSSRQGIGLRNTDRRLRQLYGQGLHIQSAPGHGTKISFIIPIQS